MTDIQMIRCYNAELNQVRYIKKHIVDSGAAGAQGYFPQSEPDELDEVVMNVNPFNTTELKQAEPLPTKQKRSHKTKE